MANKKQVLVFGSVGAILSCGWSMVDSKPSSLISLDQITEYIPIQPLISTIMSASIVGFVMGNAVLLVCVFMRAVIVRFLLGYNGWFLNPKNPINKIWFILMLALIGKKNWGSGKYQYLMPSLPAPSLDQTLQRYLDSVRPLLTQEEYNQTEKAVWSFKKQGGRKLQFFVKLRSWTTRNWMAEWWMKYIYLRQRTPISFNSNYYGSGNRIPPTTSQLDRVAMIMYVGTKAGADFNSGLVKNPCIHGLIPMCMDGMKYISCACRIPGREEDHIKRYNMKDVDHYVVFRKGQMYEVKCKTTSGEILPPYLIRDQLEQLVELAGEEMCEDGYVCSFTGLPRTKWAELRERLMENPVNRKSLESIQSSYGIFVLAEETPQEDDFNTLALEVCNGHLYDRWFDKCISTIVFANGNFGMHVEHTAIDGMICGQFGEYLLHKEHYTENGRVPELTKEQQKKFTASYEPKQLNWNLDGFEEDIRMSKAHLQGMIDDSDLIVMQPSYSKGFPKQCRLSPDGWFQMALQLTQYKLHGKLVLTYESATTRMYYKGRTETIRPVSDHSRKWVEAMEDKSCDADVKKALLKEAIAIQERRKFEAMRGQGIDRHLFGLYVVAQWLEMDPLPDLFTDQAFQLPFNLSTSQTPISFVEPYNKDKTQMMGGFGTVTDEGYGVSYFVNNDDLVLFVINSKKSCPETSSSKFADMLYQTLEEMKELYK